MSDLTIDIDRFAKSIEDILTDVESGIEDRIPKAADGAGKVGRNAVKQNAAAKGLRRTGRYIKSWGYKANKRGKENYVEIGSRIPGLPHLLEKGHATLCGGRVPGFEHIAPAADEAFDEFERLVDEAIDEALK